MTKRNNRGQFVKEIDFSQRPPANLPVEEYPKSVWWGTGTTLPEAQNGRRRDLNRRYAYWSEKGLAIVLGAFLGLMILMYHCRK